MVEGVGEDKATGRAPAVFISYASQDAAAAARMCSALRQAGVEVWFDQSELRGGDVWDQRIRREIRDCALFIPVISANTAARHEGYFRLEWDLADQRSHMIARNKAFIVPVCLDHTPESGADVPEPFQRVQWTRLPDGDTPPAFTARIVALLRAPGAAASAADSSQASATRGFAAPPALTVGATATSRLRKNRLAIALMATITIILAYFAIDRVWLSKHTRAEKPVAAVAPAPTPTMPAIPEKSVAVLPFVDMSEKKDQEYFSDGLSEELIDMLAKVPDLRVPARTSSFYFKDKQTTIADIAKALSVSHVLEGSVRRSADKLRVTAQLIRVDNGYHVWSETYDRQLDDIFKVQDEIATAVVGALKLKLLAEPTASDRQTAIPDAHNQYLIGRHLLSGSNWAVDRSAAEAFKRAVDLDPKYAPAWAGLAEATFDASQVAASIPEYTAMGQEALTAADKAIALRPDLPDGYIARGYIRAWSQFDFQGAGQDLRRALALEPENPDVLSKYASSVLMPNGRLDEAVSAAEKALKVDPLNADTWRRLGIDQYFRGDYHAAREALQRALEINPQQSNTAAFLGFTFLVTGDPASGLPLSQRATIELFRRQGAALAEHDLGHATVAQQWLDEMIAKDADGGAYQIAQVFAWWGDKDKAIQWLERAYVQHDGGLASVKVDPLLRRLRLDPRYKAFLRKMNLPE
jgi:TolB-like protein/cytochrome c-type biogenesis protein CcmH/NrfG